MAKAVSVQCPNCGATLNVEGAAQSVVCQYCQTSCQIQRGGPKVQAPPPPRWVAGVAPPPPPPMRPVIVVPKSSNIGCIIGASILVPVLISVVGGIASWSSMSPSSSSFGQSAHGATDDTPERTPDTDFGISTKALLVDVDGDGTKDVIIGNRSHVDGEQHWIAAFDGKKGERLWRTKEVNKTLNNQGILGIAGKLLVTVDEVGEVQAFSVKNGKRKWKTSIPERADDLCAGKGFIGVVAKDKSFFAFDGKGKKVASAKQADCKRIQTNKREREIDSYIAGWSKFGEVGLPGRTPHFLKGFTSHNVIVPYKSNVRFLVAEKSPGSSVPFIVAHDGKKQLWATEVPKQDPLKADRISGTVVAAYAHGRVLAVYEVKNEDQLRVSCINAETGKHEWDVPVPKHSGDVPSGMAISKKTVFFTTWSQLSAFSLKSGKSRFNLGK